MKNGNEFEFAIRMAKGIAGQFGPNWPAMPLAMRIANSNSLLCFILYPAFVWYINKITNFSNKNFHIQ